jgi:hypothetical protein
MKRATVGDGVLANASPNPVWNSTTYNAMYTNSYDLSSLTELNQQADVYFRLRDITTRSARNGSVGTGGTSRVDNFTILAAPVPEPGSSMPSCSPAWSWLV